MALKDIIVATQADLRDNADHAIATFVANSQQVEGLRSETKIRQFALTIDEPPTLGGTDAGPNPVELVLAALASCQEITYRAYATALGIPLESVSVKLEGALDLRGFFAVKDGVRAGFNDVRGTVNLKSSASAADLAKLKEVVDAHCPVLDILRAPVPVDIKLQTERSSQEQPPEQALVFRAPGESGSGVSPAPDFACLNPGAATARPSPARSNKNPRR